MRGKEGGKEVEEANGGEMKAEERGGKGRRSWRRERLGKGRGGRAG